MLAAAAVAGRHTVSIDHNAWPTFRALIDRVLAAPDGRQTG